MTLYNNHPVDEVQGEDEDGKVERLAQSGMYINPSDAIKYLSDQLSWVSKASQSPPKDPKSVEQQQQQQQQQQKGIVGTVLEGAKYAVSRISSYPFNTSIDEESVNLSHDISMDNLEISRRNSAAEMEPKMSHRRSQSTSMLDKIIAGDAPKKDLALDLKKAEGFKREIWFWGKGHLGQSGLGDSLDRLQPINVPLKDEIWIKKAEY